MCTITFFRKRGFYILSPYRSQGCVEGQNICMHGVICFILINFIINATRLLSEKKQINLFIPTQGSRVSVRAKYLLICYCKLHSFKCGSRGGTGGPDSPWKITSYMVSIGKLGKYQLDPPPPWKKLDPHPTGKCWTPSGTLKNDSFL